ncbi:MAG: GNAT family N-acetyltransferase [Acidimicrobiia bacterium]|nr:GNAT family N-acetyltransferase [Acidimicrobiia bacterium]MCL4293224.1 GNAT family N-acetyltransferase [Acidimicrobiia bacterium]
MRAALHPIEGIGQDLVSAWASLAERAIEPNPYLEPMFVLPAARHLGERYPLALLAVHRGASMVAALPVVHRPSWRRIRWPGWATFRHDYCFLGTPLVDRDHLEPAAAALAGASGRLGAGLFVMEWVRLDGPVVGALRGALATAGRFGAGYRGPIRYERFERPALGSGGRPRLAASRLRRYRRATGRLAGDAPAPEPVDRPAAEAGDAVGAFLDLERSGWKGSAGTAFASRPGHADFLREVVDGFGAADRLRLVTMEDADHALAMTWHLKAPGAEFFFKTAYDESWKRAAPGIQVVAAAFEAAAATGASVDSCASPDERYLRELMPGRIPIGTLVFPPRGAGGVALRGAIRALIALRDGWDARRGVSGDLP